VANTHVDKANGNQSDHRVDPVVIVMIVVALVLVVVGIVGPRLLRQAWATEEASAQGAIETSRTNAAEATNDAVAAQNVEVKTATGFDAARKDADTKAIDKFLGVACTWDSQEAYAKARETLQREYGVLPTSSFLTEFMPVIEHDTVNSRGQVIEGQNPIDSMHLNMVLGDVTVYLGAVDGDVYDYFCDFDMLSTSGSNSSSAHALLVCSVDGQGRVLDPVAVRV
jgi:hypothetical protein